LIQELQDFQTMCTATATACNRLLTTLRVHEIGHSADMQQTKPSCKKRGSRKRPATEKKNWDLGLGSAADELATFSKEYKQGRFENWGK
jgi:hypothetical protein